MVATPHDRRIARRRWLFHVSLKYSGAADLALRIAKEAEEWIYGEDLAAEAAAHTATAPITAPSAALPPTNKPSHAVNDLTPVQRSVWMATARYISEMNRSPTTRTIADQADVKDHQVVSAMNTLVRYGYICRSGSYRNLRLHIERWPAGILPPEMRKPEDGEGAPTPAETAALLKAEAVASPQTVTPSPKPEVRPLPPAPRPAVPTDIDANDGAPVVDAEQFNQARAFLRDMGYRIRTLSGGLFRVDDEETVTAQRIVTLANSERVKVGLKPILLGGGSRSPIGNSLNNHVL